MCPAAKGIGDRIGRPESGDGGKKAKDTQRFPCPLRFLILFSSSPLVVLVKLFMFPSTSRTMDLLGFFILPFFLLKNQKTQTNKVVFGVRVCFDFRVGVNANILGNGF